MKLPPVKSAAWILLLGMAFVPPVRAALRVLDNAVHHLGAAGQPEWDIFQGQPPEGEELHLTFDAERNAREFSLFIRQDDVKQDWTVKLNGKRLGSLFLMEADLVQTLSVPADTLVNGKNELTIATRKLEDILIREVTLGDQPAHELAAPGELTVSVREAQNRALVPCRLTVVDETGTLAPIFPESSTNLATRPGVIYTATGTAKFKVLPGRYTLFATRGPEYGLVSVKDIDPARDQHLDLILERQADTRGWVAADTHIHSLTLSRHGDALLAERVITLAGEGIELPICTEHNLHAGYGTLPRDLGVDRFFTTVSGNEVTTGTGHFNIFPVDTNAPPPDQSLESWPELFKAIRSTPQVQVAILNHPTDIHSSFTPFAGTNLNYATGQNLRGNFKFDFDGMEVINSGAMRSDWMEPFRAWFALLNRGYKITAVGASDCHDVSRFIVGQGRTYLRMDDSDVAHIDVTEACRIFKAGHAVVSLGLFPGLTLSDQSAQQPAAGPGDLLSPKTAHLNCRMTVDAPLAPNRNARLILYANGLPLQELAFPDPRGTRHELNLPLSRPLHDTFYVLIATIDYDPAPAWGLARPYQPTDKNSHLRLLGATNPVWLDADGDGQFSSARDYASAALAKYSVSPELFAHLSSFDQNVAAHTAELLEERHQSMDSPQFVSLLQKSTPTVQRGFAAYQAGKKHQGNSIPPNRAAP